MEYSLLFILLGFFLGAFGTLVGTGGGFILVPVLLWLYPEQSPEFITSISLAVVCVNSLSGGLAYRRMKRIDYRSGIVLALATAPGAVLGALGTAYIPRNTFDLFVGILLLVACVLLLVRPYGMRRSPDSALSTDKLHHQPLSSRQLVVGGVLSFFIGLFSSLLGISGGIFQVPMLVYGLHLPVHIAVATSEFVLALKGLAATSVHVVSGTVFAGLSQIFTLSLGVFAGAQAGAWLSSHVRGEWIMRALALSIGSIGIRFVATALAL
jgi:hypothetical protein